ncbi:MAG: UpxY family transcription antiterminator [Bryobacteraceae bacterium]|nr:UpxY family transcription antiterminator [Bryobacteraceae bacterium]
MAGLADPSEQPPWFAVRVRSNYEKTTSNYLQQKGYEEFTPLYKARKRWSDRIREVELPLFPGYVFCRFDPKKRLPILQTPGVVSVVGFGYEPAPVDPLEITHLQHIVSNGRNTVPWPYLKAGQKVRVTAGALYGLEGILLDLRNKSRIIVSVTLLQRSVAAEIDRADIEPVI